MTGLRRRATRALATCGAVAAIAVAGFQTAEAQRIGFIRDTEVEELLKDYARPIFRAANLGSDRVAMRIVNQDVFNAFVIDGKNVFINTGALLESATPNQVIGVIAHEVGHISGGHLAALRARIAQDQTKCLLFQILGVGLMVAGGGGQTTGAGAGIMAGGCSIVERSLLAERRAQESAADQAGLAYLNATRQSGRGLLETFERFAQQEYLSEASQDAFARSHPVAANRLAQLRTSVAKSPYHNEKDPPPLQLRHDLMRAKLRGFCRPRIDVVREYPAANTSLPARYARAIANSCTGNCSGRCPSVTPAGLEEIDALIRSDPKNPYFWELKGHVLMTSGRQAEAIEPIRKAITFAPNANFMSVRLAEALLQSRGLQGADEAITLARKSIGNDPSPEAYNVLANAYAKKDLLPQAEYATAEGHFLAGNVEQAKIFAKRSLRGLKHGTPEAIRAGDIVNYKIKS
jgi:predicted Zn-dependent protease